MKINGKKMFCYEGSIFVAGSAIQWLRDNMLFFKNSKETDKIYSKANKRENIIVVPALTGLGAPHWEPNTRGAIFGLTRNTSQADIIKATLDSLSFQTLDLIESMEKDAKIKSNFFNVLFLLTLFLFLFTSLFDFLQKTLCTLVNVQVSQIESQPH